MDLLKIVEDDYKAAYSHFVSIDKVDDNQEAHCICPRHDDNKTSLHINMDSGKWHCKSCDRGGNHIISFYSFLYDCDSVDAEEELKVALAIDPSPVDETELYAKALYKSGFAMDYLAKRHISMDIIQQYRLGFDGKRVHIPIYDFGWNLRNVRKHLIRKDLDEQKMLSSFKGVGAVRIFPIQNIHSDTIWIFEGEMDCLCALSQGINAITMTGGAGSWNLKFNKYFIDKKVYICYDNDEAGINGAKKIANSLAETAREVFIVNFPAGSLETKQDFTDYIIKYGYEAFKQIAPTKLVVENIESPTQEIHLSESTNSCYYNKKVMFNGIISGKGSLFNVPKKIHYGCTPTEDCSCPLKKQDGKMLKTLHTDNPLCLNLFNIDVTEQKQILKNIMGITSKCNKVRITVVEVYNLEELLIIPELDFNSTIASSYTSRVAYSISLGTLDTNKPYKFQGIALPNPKNMKSTIMIYKAESIKDNIDEFELTDAVKEKLRVFQSNDLLSSRQILKTKYNDYEAVTKIFERRLLFFGVDLIYHSALSFNFRGERVKRGYVNGLIFGDTRTGKSKTVEALMQHFRAGDSTGGENISFAGLVGGVQKSDIGGWGITWKILPLNDRRLIKIDEFHEMNDDDIRKMSELISTGVASIQKIHSEKTMARTRLIMIANPKTGKNLNTYPYGCMGVLPIMGHHNEDVARLDFAYPLKKDDVDFKSISAKKSTNLDIDVYTSDVCHALVMWVWSRKYNDIIITTEAEEAIDRYSETQIAKYSDDLPLVPSGEHDIKLARMSVACAGMFFSTDETCTKIIVHDYHVELVYKWLEAVYSSKTMGYDAFSIDKKGRNDLVNEGLLDELGITTAIKNLLMSTDRITLASIEHIFNVDREVARMKLHVLLTSNAVELLTNNQYKKTPAFIKWLFQKKFALHDAGFKSSLL